LIAAFWLKYSRNVNSASYSILVLNVKPAVNTHVDNETGHLDLDKADGITCRQVLIPNSQH